MSSLNNEKNIVLLVVAAFFFRSSVSLFCFSLFVITRQLLLIEDNLMRYAHMFVKNHAKMQTSNDSRRSFIVLCHEMAFLFYH